MNDPTNGIRKAVSRQRRGFQGSSKVSLRFHDVKTPIIATRYASLDSVNTRKSVGVSSVATTSRVFKLQI